MNQSWQKLLHASGATIHGEYVHHFSNLASELIVARDSTIICPLVHLGLIGCKGQDAKSFLHSQLTSDVNQLVMGCAQHASWCTAKGRMLANFLLFQESGDYRILLSIDLLKTILERLKIYVFRSNLTLENLDHQYVFLGLSGKHATEVLEKTSWSIPAQQMEIKYQSEGAVIRLERSRFILMLKEEAIDEQWKALSRLAIPAGTPAWFWLDIQAGTPLINKNTSEAFVPQMLDFNKIGGVSFKKGCYPGQEVIARTRYLGKIGRHLYRLKMNGCAAPGAHIYPKEESAEQSCGMIVSNAPSPSEGYEALAVIQGDFVDTGNLAQRFIIDSPQKIEIVHVERVHNQEI